MHTPSTPEPLRCDDLDAAIDAQLERGYRLDMIMPADGPRVALLSRGDDRLRLELDRPRTPWPEWRADALWISRSADAEGWAGGRAGMQYRDLIPSRLGGRAIASHIRIPGGGPVNDYVHFHQIGFQLIYCLRGWVRVVYEDQGEPFVMRAGDCVLQPPLIRHRVLESGDDLEVFEIASPAEHETFREHAIELPNGRLEPDRDFGGQRFVRHQADIAQWTSSEWAGFEQRDSGISRASRDAVSLRVLRASAAVDPELVDPPQTSSNIHTIMMLSGALELRLKDHDCVQLDAGDFAVLPPGQEFALRPLGACEVLEVRAG